MASTFESLVHPFIILLSAPLALVGVGIGLFVTQTPISVVVFIGLIVLAGVVVNNAIVLVDTVNRNRIEGDALDQAILRASAQRLRPIMVTTMTTILGLLPLTLGIGAGAEVQRPLAITVTFGLASATLLTLVVIPAMVKMVGQIPALGQSEEAT
jgi:HAE1 family hydrophobic/amphiphilic exporter-1